MPSLQELERKAQTLKADAVRDVDSEIRAASEAVIQRRGENLQIAKTLLDGFLIPAAQVYAQMRAIHVIQRCLLQNAQKLNSEQVKLKIPGRADLQRIIVNAAGASEHAAVFRVRVGAERFGDDLDTIAQNSIPQNLVRALEDAVGAAVGNVVTKWMGESAKRTVIAQSEEQIAAMIEDARAKVERDLAAYLEENAADLACRRNAGEKV